MPRSALHRLPMQYYRPRHPVNLGADDWYKDQNFLITSGIVAVGTVAVLVFLKQRKKRRK